MRLQVINFLLLTFLFLQFSNTYSMKKETSKELSSIELNIHNKTNQDCTIKYMLADFIETILKSSNSIQYILHSKDFNFTENKIIFIIKSSEINPAEIQFAISYSGVNGGINTDFSLKDVATGQLNPQRESLPIVENPDQIVNLSLMGTMLQDSYFTAKKKEIAMPKKPSTFKKIKNWFKK
jgi:hypothetical protein